METLELDKISTGTVENFLTTINSNFDKIQKDPNITRTITFSTDMPSGGKDGDIWIVYEGN